jgi:ABC-type antimicrobial peptide transport system permease subunit
MGLIAILNTASGALRRNIMRTLLTTPGIVIGVGAVITMMEIGNGASLAIQHTLTAIGANTLVIIPGAQNVGGIMGIIVGRGASMLVSKLLHWPTAPSMGAVIAAVVVSASIGVIFGFYPAWKGSRLDPIDALRYE